MNKLSVLMNHVAHFIPLSQVDFQRLSIHVIASFFGALATILNSGMPARTVLIGWLAGVLLYVSGYLQRSYKEDVEVPVKVNKDGS